MPKRRYHLSSLKKVIFWFLVFLFLIPTPVWGVECVPEGEVTDLMEVITCMLGNLANFLVTVSPFIAAALLAFGGIKYMASAGEERSLQSAKQFLTWVFLGFLATFGVIFIIRVLMFILRGDVGTLPFL